MIAVETLTFGHRGAPAPVLRDIGFTLAPGQVTTLLGPNGSGKTSLLRCVAGHWRPQAGRVLLGGDDVAALSARDRAKRLALVPQDQGVAFSYSVRDMVLMGRGPHVGPFGMPGGADRDMARQALEAVGIAALADRDIRRISGGERQLALVARALAQATPALLLDEPTSHLDLRNQLAVRARIRDIGRDRGLTVLMTLHDPNLALMFADRVLLLKDGRVVADDRPDRAITESTVHAVYGVAADVRENGGRRWIVPRDME
ncbi:MAG: ABC transporter ATP-binding protein [Telmatospirillum sp.]|nr:ABC transporter ATP-binding protein [Telmatospirillum sp.]